MRCYCKIASPIGILTAVSQNGCLTALHFGSVTLPDDAVKDEEDPALICTKQWLNRYFSGEMPELTIPLNPTGTQFQHAVWDLLTRIPYGTSVTYGNLAKQLGKPNMSAQAVGQAVGRNPIPILVPCHRVLGAGGWLTGFTGGLDKKRFLLDLEGIPYR